MHHYAPVAPVKPVSPVNPVVPVNPVSPVNPVKPEHQTAIMSAAQYVQRSKISESHPTG
jgi:hypothetical protein